MSKAPDWPQLKLLFINGSMSLADLAREHGIKESTMRNRAQREQWQEARDEVRRSVTEKVVEKVTLTRAEQIDKWNEGDFAVAVMLRSQVVAKLRRAAMPQAAELSPGEIRLLASAADTASKIARLALGVSTENRAHHHSGNLDAPEHLPEVSVEKYLEARARLLQDY